MADGNGKVRPLLTPKVPPHSEEAEMSVLGGIMIDGRALMDVADRIAEADFYFEKHRLIYRALVALTGQNKPCDFVIVSDYLRDAGQLEAVDGMPYLGQLVNDTPGAANVSEYAKIVRDRAILRGLIAAGDTLADLAFRPDGRSADEIMDVADRALFDLRGTASRGRSGPRSVREGVGKAMAEIEAAHKAGGVPQGLSSGYAVIDDMTAGFEPGDLVILAGRPSMGKTTLAMNIAEHVALKLHKGVAVFSMEMGEAQLSKRLLSSITGLEFNNLKRGLVESDAQWNQLSDAQRCIEVAPLWIDETGGLTALELRARARRLASRHPLSLVVVDYLQLMSGNGEENRTQQVTEISKSLKALAKELACPVLALSQLNRGVEARENKRPRMADLRESGGIEQDADIIAFVYRDEVYNANSGDKGTAEIIFSKQRNGPLGTVRLASRLDVSRFDALAPSWQPEAAPASSKPSARGFRPAAQPSRADWQQTRKDYGND